jgi:aspartyl-tRNA(Asn)/glutamyl-tRNA(Gln) amidotransferase subunit B
MPAERRARVAAAAGLPADADGVVTVVRLDLDSFVMAAADVGADAALAVKRLANEVAAELDRARHLDPDAFCRLILMEGKGELTSAQARTVLKQVLTQGGDPVKVAKELGYEAMAADDMTAIVDQVIADHSPEWRRFVAGEDKLQGFLLGKIKTASGGKADLNAARELLRERRAQG